MPALLRRRLVAALNPPEQELVIKLDWPVFHATDVDIRRTVFVATVDGALGDATLLLSDHIIAHELDATDPYSLGASGPAAILRARPRFRSI
jgi:hypothetical protein